MYISLCSFLLEEALQHLDLILLLVGKHVAELIDANVSIVISDGHELSLPGVKLYGLCDSLYGCDRVQVGVFERVYGRGLRLGEIVEVDVAEVGDGGEDSGSEGRPLDVEEVLIMAGFEDHERAVAQGVIEADRAVGRARQE